MVYIKEENPQQQDPKQEEEKKEEKMDIETSPLHSHLHPKSESPQQQPQSHENLSQIIAMDRRARGFSPLHSPPTRTPQPIPIPIPVPVPVPVQPLSPVIVVNRSIRDELSAVSKVGHEENGVSVDGGSERRSKTVSSILWRERRLGMVKRAALGFRVLGVVFCLISFSVMAADKTQGWAGDSFYRYKEYRYSISVTVIGFVYSGFQAYDLAYDLITAKHIIQHHFRYSFDFSMDQILTYLLLSASSAAASRVDDWVSSFGKDDFTVMASASIGMSFLAFVTFAFSSLISGYNLCTRSET